MTDPILNAGWHVQAGPAGTTIVLTGDWSIRNPPVADAAVAAIPPGALAFETSKLGTWDSALLVFLSLLRRRSAAEGSAFDQAGLPESTRVLLALLTDDPPAPPAAEPGRGLRDWLGRGLIAAGTEAVAVVELLGEVILRSLGAMRGRARVRAVDVTGCMYDAGLAALPIVTVVNILVGAILAFVGAVQLRRFGADIYIANLVGVAVVREMAALMTAIVLSGRTGGAYAAEIATMQGSEEIDALRAIGIPVQDYLVLPRVWALTAMTPLLYLYGSAVGIFGGFVVAIGMLDLSPQTFTTQMIGAVTIPQIVFGFVKSITFGLLIALAGCRIGLTAGRSATDVGKAATTAVVVGIVGVIVVDAIFAICANAVGF